MRRRVLVSIGVYLTASVALWLLPSGREPSPVTFAAPPARVVWPLSEAAPDEERRVALQQARVWAPIDVAAVDLAANPPDPSGALSDPIVRCHYLDSPARGTTAKFDCVLRDGKRSRSPSHR
jgi:hypothetical protein